MPFEVTGQLQNPQQFQVGVTGPNGANSLFLCSGIVSGGWGGPQQSADMLTFLVGPKFNRDEFVRAECAIGLGGVFLYQPQADSSVQITASDADWDDESGQVMVRINYAANGMVLYGLSYYVSILAQQAQPPA